MKLNLTKPLVIFDLETTGLDLVKDRIIQISYIKVSPNGDEERGDELVNPERPIEPIITQLTGISNEDVKDKPTFKQLSQKLADKFTGCDFAGFNSNHFDIPLLAEEFLRAGIDFDFSKCRMIDAQTIFHKMERRNLAAAYKFYCGRKMEEDFEAHRADQDTEATYRVLMGELDKYAPGANEDAEKVLENDMDKLAEFSKLCGFRLSSLSASLWKALSTSADHFFLAAFFSSSYFSGDDSPCPISACMFLICCCRK